MPDLGARGEKERISCDDEGDYVVFGSNTGHET